MSEFNREDRYIVLKIKDLEKLPLAEQNALKTWVKAYENILPKRQCVVIESDWPEYEVVWSMLQARVEIGRAM